MTNTVILSSIVERRPGDGTVSFSLMGEPFAAAVVDAVRTDYHHVTGRSPVTHEQLAALNGTSVTLLRAGESEFGSGSIQTTEGTIFLAGDNLAYLPKGKRKNGYRLSPGGVLDVEVGYNKVGVLRERVERVKATFPEVEKLTREHLLALPEEAPSPAQIGLVVFGTWRGPDGRSSGAVWCLHSYMREDDIVEGFLLVRPEDGESEHGSIYGKQLLSFGGRVVNPPAMSFAESMELRNLPYHEALARFATSIVEA